MSHDIDAAQPLAGAIAHLELAIQDVGVRAEQLAGLLEQMWHGLERLRDARRREHEAAGIADIPDAVDRLLQRLQDSVRGNLARLQSHDSPMLPLSELQTIRSALAQVIERGPASQK
jgi:hypothetical protein